MSLRYNLAKIKHNMVIMKNCVNLTRILRSRPKNTVENFKHLKSQHLFDKPKNTVAMTSTQY